MLTHRDCKKDDNSKDICQTVDNEAIHLPLLNLSGVPVIDNVVSFYWLFNL